MADALSAERLFDIGVQAIEKKQLGRLRRCLDVLFARSSHSEAEPADNPHFALLTLLRKGASPSNGPQIEGVCIRGLRKLYSESEGPFRHIASLTILWPLLCANCRISDPEASQEIEDEVDQLEIGPAPLTPHLLPTLWFWRLKNPDFLELHLYLLHNIYPLLTVEFGADNEPTIKKIVDLYLWKNPRLKSLEATLEAIRKLIRASLHA